MKFNTLYVKFDILHFDILHFYTVDFTIPFVYVFTIEPGGADLRLPENPVSVAIDFGHNLPP